MAARQLEWGRKPNDSAVRGVCHRDTANDLDKCLRPLKAVFTLKYVVPFGKKRALTWPITAVRKSCVSDWFGSHRETPCCALWLVKRLGLALKRPEASLQRLVRHRQLRRAG